MSVIFTGKDGDEHELANRFESEEGITVGSPPQTPIERIFDVKKFCSDGNPECKYCTKLIRETKTAIYNLLAEMAVEVRDPNGFITKHFKAIPLDKLKELLDE